MKQLKLLLEEAKLAVTTYNAHISLLACRSGLKPALIMRLSLKKVIKTFLENTTSEDEKAEIQKYRTELSDKLKQLNKRKNQTEKKKPTKRQRLNDSEVYNHISAQSGISHCSLLTKKRRTWNRYSSMLSSGFTVFLLCIWREQEQEQQSPPRNVETA